MHFDFLLFNIQNENYTKQQIPQKTNMMFV